MLKPHLLIIIKQRGGRTQINSRPNIENAGRVDRGVVDVEEQNK